MSEQGKGETWHAGTPGPNDFWPIFTERDGVRWAIGTFANQDDQLSAVADHERARVLKQELTKTQRERDELQARVELLEKQLRELVT